MNRALPPITESAEVLRTMLKAERRPKARQRIHTLYVLASGQARSRTAVAALLGVNRDTIGTWLQIYATGGLDGLLALYRPAGKPPGVPADVQAALRERLAQPAGFGSYGEIQTWLHEQHGLTISYSAVRKLVVYKLQARLKVARPVHEKKTLPTPRPSPPT